MASPCLTTTSDIITYSALKDEGTRFTPALDGLSREITICNITENGYEEYHIRIKENTEDNSDTALIENLNEGNYVFIPYGHRYNSFSNQYIETDEFSKNNENESNEVANYKFVVINEKDEEEEYQL